MSLYIKYSIMSKRYIKMSFSIIIWFMSYIKPLKELLAFSKKTIKFRKYLVNLGFSFTASNFVSISLAVIS